MSSYVALLRGIGPTNPNMRGEKLRAVFESLGFQKVQTVIASGNVVFESSEKNTRELEIQIEEALFIQLGFHSPTIIRSREQIQKILDQRPFGNREHSRTSYLVVTFFKHPRKESALPQHENKSYDIVGVTASEAYSALDTTSAKTTDFMVWLEKQFGKEITTRTWKTLEKIAKK